MPGLLVVAWGVLFVIGAAGVLVPSLLIRFVQVPVIVYTLFSHSTGDRLWVDPLRSKSDQQRRHLVNVARAVAGGLAVAGIVITALGTFA